MLRSANLESDLCMSQKLFSPACSFFDVAHFGKLFLSLAVHLFRPVSLPLHWLAFCRIFRHRKVLDLTIV